MPPPPKFTGKPKKIALRAAGHVRTEPDASAAAPAVNQGLPRGHRRRSPPPARQARAGPSRPACPAARSSAPPRPAADPPPRRRHAPPPCPPATLAACSLSPPSAARPRRHELPPPEPPASSSSRPDPARVRPDLAARPLSASPPSFPDSDEPSPAMNLEPRAAQI